MNEQGADNFPELISFDSRQIIEWCITRKKEMGISNAKLADMTGVPEGTVDRIFTGRNNEYRYSTIQPILRYLIGFDDATPDNKPTHYYADTIEGYKLAVENKNNSINVLKSTYQSLTQQIEFLKKLNNEKQQMIESLTKHIAWLESIIDKPVKTKQPEKKKKSKK